MKRQGSVGIILLCCLPALAGGGFLAARWWPLHAAMRDLRTLEVGNYYDPHGNPCPPMQTLMIARFGATSRILHELESGHPGVPAEFRLALMNVLAFVKDPAGIPWLEKQLGGDHAVLIRDPWLAKWTPTRAWEITPPPGESKWLQGAEAWASFFRRWMARSDAADLRGTLLRTMAAWFHDPSTVEYFESLAAQDKFRGEDRLILLLYLQKHGRPVDSRMLESTIAALRGTERGRTLVDCSQVFRNEAFVPLLIPMSDDSKAQDALERITLRSDIQGKSGWEAWQAVHGAKGREAWIREAVQDFELLLSKDEGRAKERLDKAVYVWNDIALLPSMERWVERPALASLVVGWINLTYHPAHRDRLRRLAERALDRASGRLEPWAMDLLKDLDFVEDREATWEQFVRLRNSRV